MSFGFWIMYGVRIGRRSYELSVEDVHSQMAAIPLEPGRFGAPQSNVMSHDLLKIH